MTKIDKVVVKVIESLHNETWLNGTDLYQNVERNLVIERLDSDVVLRYNNRVLPLSDKNKEDLNKALLVLELDELLGDI